MTYEQARLALYNIESESPLSRIPAFRISDIIASLDTARSKRSLASAEALKSLHLAELDGYTSRAWDGIRDTIVPPPADPAAKLRRDIAYRQHRQSIVGLTEDEVTLLYESGTDEFRAALETDSPVRVRPDVVHKSMHAHAEKHASAALVEVDEMEFTRGKFADLFDALIAEVSNH